MALLISLLASERPAVRANKGLLLPRWAIVAHALRKLLPVRLELGALLHAERLLKGRRASGRPGGRDG